MIIRKTFLVHIKIDTQLANINHDKWGETYDWDGYPNWKFNYAGEENSFIESNFAEFKEYFKFKGLFCRVTELKSSIRDF
jgi:hypothetical protein